MAAYWIIVANASRARIFEAEGRYADMREIIDLTHPDSRQHEGDLVSDRGGHMLSGTTGSHAIDREQVAKQQEAEVFAKSVCERLEQGRNAGNYGKLHIVAAPRFLGLIRQHMSKPLQAMVGEEIAKDLTMADENQVRAQFV